MELLKSVSLQSKEEKSVPKFLGSARNSRPSAGALFDVSPEKSQNSSEKKAPEVVYGTTDSGGGYSDDDHSVKVRYFNLIIANKF